jgi:hypothetical protein
MLAWGSMIAVVLAPIELLSGVYQESDTSLTALIAVGEQAGLLALLLLAVATGMATAGIRLLPKGASRHHLALVGLTLTLTIVGVLALLFFLFLIALSQDP